ncbi:MAG: STAS domain-containing protein [Leptospiraceae bacterium]|nr:STAS domain-containing protein [Leptospiraceae bacterium]MCB1314407.1 STAS domain-containing protein [Leptospiraceae bacterium]MCB1319834.1 STAS domain-containing protein [Leptospiraceae bacterium]
MSELTIECHTENSILIMSLTGMLDGESARQIEKKFAELFSEENFRIIVDCAGLDYMSSAGLGALMSALQRARDNDGDIKILNMSETVQRLFRAVGLHQLFRIYSSKDEALNSF